MSNTEIDSFSGLAGLAWVHTYGKERTAKDCEIIAHHLQLRSGDRIADICCGQGRHAIYLADRYRADIWAVDGSHTLIEIGRERASDLNLSINFIHSKVEDIDLSGITKSFKAAYCLGSSFGHGSKSTHTLFLRKIASLIEKDGKFIMETILVDEALKFPKIKETSNVYGDILVVREEHYDQDKKCLRTICTYSLGSRKEKANYYFTIYTLDELKTLLESNGFKVIVVLDESSPSIDLIGLRKRYYFLCKAE